MPGTLLERAAALRACLAGFEPALVSGDDAASIAEQLAITEKACAAARARAALRAAECRSHERRGFADAADWLARIAGSTRGNAQAAMATAAAVAPGSATSTALAAGDLSLEQAQVISRTEAECPGSEGELLALSKHASLAKLQDEGRRHRLAAADPEELHRRHHRAREFRHWRDGDGMIRLAGALPPEVGVPLMNRLDDETDRIRRAATEPEPRVAHAADALVAMLKDEGSGKRSSTDLVLVCDLNAYRRGHAHEAEPCHIVGGGPVPVSVLRRLAEDAFLKVVLHDGVRIETVVHFGRHIRTELRTALELGAPPRFDGVECVDPGCDRRYDLEWDHVDPVANNGPTSFDNLQPRCWPHHRAKTARDRQAGLARPVALGDRRRAARLHVAPPARGARRRDRADRFRSRGLSRGKSTEWEVRDVRKVVVYELLSLDGVAEGPDRFFGWDDAMDANLGAVIATQDSVVLGRRSYDEWAGYWPDSDMEPFASFINGVAKYVATSTPLDPEWANSTVVEGGLVEFMRELKNQPGADIGVHASISVAQALLAAGVVDELRLVIAPAVAGSGRRLLDSVPATRLESIRSTTSPTGHLLVDYRVTG